MINKYLLAGLALMLTVSAYAQLRPVKPLLTTPNITTKANQNAITVPETFVPPAENPPFAGDRGPEEVVGSTFWDAQSYGAISPRIYANQNGEPVAYWLYSAQTSGYSDRGTARNVRVNGTWSTVTSRVEAVRTGFPSAAMLGDGSEIIISHNTSATPWAIWMAKKAPGSNTWTEKALPTPPGIRMLWPKIAIGGTDNMTIHVIAITAPTGTTTGGVIYQGLNGHLLYYRSTDGGATWDKQYVIIPGIDNTHYAGFSADSYTIDASGNTAAIGIFKSYDWNDMHMYKSTDNGGTWSDLIVRDFPDALEGYTPAPGVSYTADDITEVDTLSPDPLAVLTNDGFGSVLVDQNGQAHVWFGRMYVVDNDFTDSSSFIYPGTNGIMYWKDTWAPNNLQIIAGAYDYDGNGSIVSSLDQIAPYGGANISSFPVTGIDANGTIYLCYSALNETRISSENDEIFRNLYLMKSTSNGDGWGNPIELTEAPYVDESIAPFLECVWPSLPRHIGSKVWVLYQQDFIPGSNVWGAHHSSVENTINWIEIDPADLPVGVHEAPFSSSNLDLNISPNPASSVANLSMTLEQNEPVLVEISNIMGSRVSQTNLPATKGRQSLALNTQNLLAGNYFVTVRQGNQFATTRLVIER